MPEYLNPLAAFIGYSWKDGTSAELLHEELAARGLTVMHDHCTFDVGWRLEESMAEAVNRCDGYVPLLTPNSLYEDATPDGPRPALDNEFIPILARRAASAAAGERPARPAIAIVTRDLGDPHRDAPSRIQAATGEDVSDIWSIAVDQDGEELADTDAAAVAQALLDALLPPGAAGPVDQVPLTVVTRGSGEAPTFLTIDATSRLGGPERRPGLPEDWARFLTGVHGVARVLAQWTTSRRVLLTMKGHMTASVAVGRAFNQAAGWRHQLTSDRLDVPDHPDRSPTIEPRPGPSESALVVAVDLLGHPVLPMAIETGVDPDEVGIIAVSATDEMLAGDMSAGDIERSAAAVARAVRQACAAQRPEAIQLFVAAPAAFAVHLGARLTSLGTDLHIYERDGAGYVRVLVIPHGLA